MTTRVFNFLWLGLDLPAKKDPKDGIHQPMPEKYIESLRKAGTNNPDTNVVLWVDSKRLTERQMAYLKDKAETGMENVRIKDLRSIPAYRNQRLYNRGETNAQWRDAGQAALIWRQVDCAKILVCLQGDYDQTFFADFDRAHLHLASDDIQFKLERHGLMIGSGSELIHRIENQAWGFTKDRREFFQQYYRGALKAAHKGENAWEELRDRARALMTKESLYIQNICLLIRADGTEAEHPGHKFRGGRGVKQPPSTIAVVPLAEAFKDGATKGKKKAPAASKKKPAAALKEKKP